ncbi:hypothetical protein B0H34DRAFT_450098 [Crassisporium funariophilum]|nr:hypothetical protein B0H34DRAFT_450098 [Crassisporium funariophilum]
MTSWTMYSLPLFVSGFPRALCSLFAVRCSPNLKFNRGSSCYLLWFNRVCTLNHLPPSHEPRVHAIRSFHHLPPTYRRSFTSVPLSALM